MVTKFSLIGGLRFYTLILQLEKAATAGVVVVVAVIGIVMYEAIKAGLPGITSGELPIFSMQVRHSVLPVLWSMAYLTLHRIYLSFNLGEFGDFG